MTRNRLASAAAHLATFALVLGMGAWAMAVADDDSAPTHRDSRSAAAVLPPCPTEDSDDCRWDADVQGNGAGRSFYTLRGVTAYLDGGAR